MVGWQDVIEVIVLAELEAIVSKSAPLLANALNPASPLSSVVLSLIAHAFGGSPTKPDEVLQRVQQDPEAQLKLRGLQYQHQEALSQLDLQKYQAEIGDRTNAREACKSNTGFLKYMPAILSIFFTGIYAYIQYMVIVQPGNVDDVISARVQDIIVMIVSFYFGSSHKK